MLFEYEIMFIHGFYPPGIYGIKYKREISQMEGKSQKKVKKVM